MNIFPLFFRVVSAKNCPLYGEGELFRLNEQTLVVPQGKETCLLLARSLTELLFQIRFQDRELSDLGDNFTCGGCVGLLKYSLDTSLLSPELLFVQTLEEKVGYCFTSHFLELIGDSGVVDPLSGFEVVTFVPGDILLAAGGENRFLYWLIEGEAIAELDGVLVERYKPGDIYGESSVFSEEESIVTVRAASEGRCFCVDGKLFSNAFAHSPELQNYIADVAIQRLRRAHRERLRDLQVSLSGKLGVLAPAELLQIFHLNQKTGTLFLSLGKGTGQVIFFEGEVLLAEYAGEEGKNAIFALLNEKRGRYRYIAGVNGDIAKSPNIGDFMTILMEGVQQLDEDL